MPERGSEPPPPTQGFSDQITTKQMMKLGTRQLASLPPAYPLNILCVAYPITIIGRCLCSGIATLGDRKRIRSLRACVSNRRLLHP